MSADFQAAIQILQEDEIHCFRGLGKGYPYGFLEVLLAQTLRYGGTGAPGVYLPYRLTLRVYRKGQFVIHNSMAVLLLTSTSLRHHVLL